MSEVIAIDGPSGTGKSTVSRAVARALGWRYLDTGAMYRAATWLVLDAAAEPSTAPELLRGRGIEVGTDPDAEHVSAGGTRVETAIRSPEVTAAVSAVSAVPEMRAELVARQRELIGDGQIVVEGRDIATVVVPDARLQLFLTADPAVRAARRAGETDGDTAGAVAAITRRDTLDRTRQTSPLRPSPHAVVLDTSAMTQDEVVAHILSLARLVLS